MSIIFNTLGFFGSYSTHNRRGKIKKKMKIQIKYDTVGLLINYTYINNILKHLH